MVQVARTGIALVWLPYVMQELAKNLTNLGYAVRDNIARFAYRSRSSLLVGLTSTTTVEHKA
jgi:hypothetical protein